MSVKVLNELSQPYKLVLDPYLLSALIILLAVFMLRAYAIRKYGRKEVEKVMWARLSAWFGIFCGYLLLLAYFLLE